MKFQAVKFHCLLSSSEKFSCFVILPVSPSLSQISVEIDRAKRKQEKLKKYGSTTGTRHEVLTCTEESLNS